MGRGNTDLSSNEYDSWLADHHKENELRLRHAERQNAHKRDMSGWHFGIDTKPVKVKDMNEFRQELNRRGLSIKDEMGPSKDARRTLPWRMK
jgi:hypothetical protein